MFNRDEEYASGHKIITPSDTAVLDREYIIYAGTGGNLVIEDEHGVSITYAVTAGQILPVLARRVKATGTTVTQVIGLY